MVASPQQPYLSRETYLEREALAETKSEYLEGKIVAMAGASPAHVRITTNLTRLFGNLLAGTPCEPFDSDMRVLVEPCNAVFYPDLSVVCEAPRFSESRLATLLNPALILEVLSPTSEQRDRVTKFDCYRTLESLIAYVLVSQEEPRIEVYVRQSDGSWRYDVVKGLEGLLVIPVLGVSIPMEEIYARVVFAIKARLEEVTEG